MEQLINQSSLTDKRMSWCVTKSHPVCRMQHDICGMTVKTSIYFQVIVHSNIQDQLEQLHYKLTNEICFSIFFLRHCHWLQNLASRAERHIWRTQKGFLRARKILSEIKPRSQARLSLTLHAESDRRCGNGSGSTGLICACARAWQIRYRPISMGYIACA